MLVPSPDQAQSPAKPLGREAAALLKMLTVSFAGMDPEAVFARCASDLAALSGAEGALVARISGATGAFSVQPQAAVVDDQACSIEPFPAYLSPCNEVLKRGSFSVNGQLAAQFPRADWLLSQGAQAYSGITVGTPGHPVGIIALWSRREFSDPAAVTALLAVFAARLLTQMLELPDRQRVAMYRRQREFAEHHAGGMYTIDIEPPMPVDLPVPKQVQWLAEHGRCVDCNEALVRLFGAPGKEAIVGHSPVDINVVYDFGGVMRTLISNGYRLRDELIKNIDMKGHELWVSCTANGYVEAGKLHQVLGALIDVTERVRYIQEVEYQARHDELTGLPNRKNFTSELGARIKEARRETRFAVFILDLDGFKEINDTLGHEMGDQLLGKIADRLRSVLEPLPASLARLGGDEFAVLVHDFRNGADVNDIARDTMQAMKQPFCVHDLELMVSGSLGIALFPQHGNSVSALMRCADVAMYQAKNNGANFQVYSQEQDHHTVRRLSLMMDVRQAIRNEELLLHYQPIVNMMGLGVMGFEALVRWRHPQHGMLPPSEFIPLIELTDMIEQVTWWVIETAIRQLAAWQARGWNYHVAVNISARNLMDTRFAEHVHALLRQYGVPGERLECELTESSLMADPEQARRVLNALAAIGVKIAIDDFGTGYSSLAYLKSLPIDTLKIDRSFISQMLDNAQDRIIVNSTIQLAHNLGLEVTAEGIENRELIDALQAQGCDRGQGFFVCRPQALPELERWLQTGALLLD